MKNQKEGVESYFTNEINEKIEAMDNREMVQFLKELESTPYWIAILRYWRERSEVARWWLYSLDPIKEPAQICRLQGMISGIYDLQEAVIRLKRDSEDKNKWTKVETNEIIS